MLNTLFYQATYKQLKTILNHKSENYMKYLLHKIAHFIINGSELKKGEHYVVLVSNI